MGTKLYIGNLSYNTDDNALRAHFENAGKTVVEAVVITDRDTGRSRGFGFVTLGSDDEAKAAIEELDGGDLDGRELKVSEARERERR